jgi:hypothetical protein
VSVCAFPDQGAEKEVELLMLGECPMASHADLVLERLDHLMQTDILFRLQMTVLIGGMLWCLALALTLVFGGWYASTHPGSRQRPHHEASGSRAVSLDARTDGVSASDG